MNLEIQNTKGELNELGILIIFFNNHVFRVNF